MRVTKDVRFLFLDVSKAFDLIKVWHRGYLLAVDEWVDKWLVDFNPGKTESTIFTCKRNPDVPLIHIQETDITEVEQHKHLGINIQRSGKWSHHIAEMTSKAKKKVDVLQSLMYRLNRKSLENLYLTFI